MAEVVVITGASAGLGRATAHRFAREGAKVALLARNVAALEDAAREVAAAGGTALVVPCDVSDPAAVEAAADRIERELGPIDVWINNAVASVFAPVRDIRPEEYRRVMEVTYLGQVYGTLAALRRMRPRDRGRIVLIGSGLAYRGVPFHSAYCGAKFGLRGFFESLRTELAHDGSRVRVCMVHPSTLNTPFYSWVRTTLRHPPMAVQPIYQPEVGAEAVFWATRHDRRELRVGAASAAAAALGGLFPKTVDQVLGKVGWKVEQRDAPVEPDRPDNLFDTPGSPYGVRGDFDGQSRSFSTQLWSTTHRGWIAATALAVLTAYSAFRYRRKSR
jgi:NAD(P)-dependent dehydrogenase (short-subunit alcohol dehydrogenase family)